MKPIPELALENQPEPVVFACVLCGEARGEGRLGMEAVAQVAMNRLKNPRQRYGSTIKDVLLAPYQFSCVNPNDPNRAKLLKLWEKDPRSYSVAEDIAAKALGGALQDTVGPATHYCVKKLWNADHSEMRRPAWHSKQEIDAGRTKEVCVIGNHVFAVAR